MAYKRSEALNILVITVVLDVAVLCSESTDGHFVTNSS